MNTPWQIRRRVIAVEGTQGLGLGSQGADHIPPAMASRELSKD